MRNERGVTLVELVTVVAVGALVLVSVAAQSVPWLARETMKSSTHRVHALMQLTRIEAVSRNRPCLFLIDSASGALQVWDTLGTSTRSDDELLHDDALADTVAFAHPATGNALTLQQIDSGTWYATLFGPDGMASAGTGDVFLAGGGDFGRVSVFGAGASEVAYWNGSAWESTD